MGTDPHERARRSPQRTAATALVLLLILGAVAAWSGTRSSDRLDEARYLASPDHFETALDAGETLAEIGGLLVDEGRDCRRGNGPQEDRCAALLTASAYAQVLAAHVLRCTAPGRFEARQRIEALLDDLATGLEGATPQPPALPDCS